MGSGKNHGLTQGYIIRVYSLLFDHGPGKRGRGSETLVGLQAVTQNIRKLGAIPQLTKADSGTPLECDIQAIAGDVSPSHSILHWSCFVSLSDCVVALAGIFAELSTTTSRNVVSIFFTAYHSTLRLR